ncbi:14791_t:CDS:2 [Entrophospora sp. SA101]|nr:14791_t:CDS:2 [Entrophospora sp. SA101]
MCLESKTRGFATDTSSAIIPDHTDDKNSVKTHTPSLLESHPQISIGGVGTIPIVADAVASSLQKIEVK